MIEKIILGMSLEEFKSLSPTSSFGSAPHALKYLKETEDIEYLRNAFLNNFLWQAYLFHNYL